MADESRPSLFRSEEMVLCQFFIQDEVAFSCVEALGHLDAVQFRDVHHGMGVKDRPYRTELKVLTNSQSILNHLEAQMKKRNLEIPYGDDNISTPTPGDLLDVKETLEKFYTEVTDIDEYMQTLKVRHDETIEVQTILDLAKRYLQLIDDVPPADDDEDIEMGYRRGPETGTFKINFVGGSLRREKFASFELTLWRACRGKVVVKFEHIDYEFTDPATDRPAFETGFVVLFQGERLRELVTKIAKGYGAKLYPLPEDPALYDDAFNSTEIQKLDLEQIINRTEEHYENLLHVCAENLEDWYTQVIKMKAVYVVLNNFRIKPHVGEGWVAKSELLAVKNALKKASREAGGISEPVVSIIENDEEPPTYFWNDKITAGFQVLIDSYGIATYKEINPMPFTVITFPFLFAMMFGDLGHGILLFAFGLVMIIREKSMIAAKSRNEIRNILFGGRYIILLMGIFSIYAGLLYNDCFAVALNIFGSSWGVSSSFEEIRSEETKFLDPAIEYSGEPYPLGIDPIWEEAQNKIIFLNSFKMKISIIFGVLQMIFGLLLSLWNDWYFADYSNIVCLFVPQLLWMIALFGYLCFLMIFKWFTFGPKKPYERGTACAPSVLIEFIAMVLHKKVVRGENCPKELYPSQSLIQEILFLSAMVCIPWLMSTKPIWVFRKQSKKARAKLEEQIEENKDLGKIPLTKDHETDVEIVQNNQDKEEESNDENEKEKRISKTKEEMGTNEDEENEYWDETENETNRKKGKQSIIHVEETEEEDEANRKMKKKEHEKEEEGENKGEFMIHQGIVTIEYILGTISHTASYLRLWALSLAHSQLSKVLWSMVLGSAIQMSMKVPFVGFLVVFAAWTIWAVLTVAILVLMEGLSAFLHTLRLHWVEFNSKFFAGLGYQFVPFSFKTILSAERN